jgi:hypothetical protein
MLNKHPKTYIKRTTHRKLIFDKNGMLKWVYHKNLKWWSKNKKFLDSILGLFFLIILHWK